MLLNLSGAHGPLFTRNIVILKDNAGHTGVGEVPGGETHPADAGRRAPLGRRPARSAHYNAVLNAMRAAVSPTATPAAAASRPSTCASTIHAVTAVEAALLDLLGQYLGRAGGRAARRRPAARCGARCWAICSTSATATKTDLPYRQRAGRRRRLVPAAPRGGADARGRRAPGRSGAGALRLQGLQAQGRRAARRRGNRSRHGARRALSRRAHHARPERRLVAGGSDPAVPRTSTTCWPMPKTPAARRTAIPAARSWPSSAAPPACRPRPT